MLAIGRLALNNVFIQFLGVVSFEGELARHQLSHELTETPHINGVGIASTSQNLGGDVSRSATVGERLPTLHDLCKAEVHQLHVSPLELREHDILWLEVPVNDISFVQVLKSHQHF